MSNGFEWISGSGTRGVLYFYKYKEKFTNNDGIPVDRDSWVLRHRRR